MMKNEDLTKYLLALLRREPKNPKNPLTVQVCIVHVHPKDEDCKFKLDIPLNTATPAKLLPLIGPPEAQRRNNSKKQQQLVCLTLGLETCWIFYQNGMAEGKEAGRT